MSQNEWALPSLKAYKQSYPARSEANFRLSGVANGNEKSLASAYVANMRGGIMQYERGQIANIIRHAELYKIKPRNALEAIKNRVAHLGDEADEYQKMTGKRVEEALKHLR